MRSLLEDIAGCRLCEAHLPAGPRPVVRAAPGARVLIVGQAPGRRVHATGIPWNDPSGVRLRQWLDVDEAAFYDPSRFALVPMGFCYPGTGKGGDLPPRPECAPRWHPPLLAAMPQVRLTLLLSRYALERYLGPVDSVAAAVRAALERYLGPVDSVAAAVRAALDGPEHVLALPHPSPRNNRWLREHPWFEAEVVPLLRQRVRDALQGAGG